MNNGQSGGRYKWAAVGDINAFFGLMLDNIAGLILTVFLLHQFFEFPVDFAIRYMVPGTALGVMVGDLMYFAMAFWLARKSGKTNVTAMPLGLDTPSTIGMIFFVIGPAFVAAKESLGDETAAATVAWHIGMCAILLTGAVKMIFAFGSNWIRHLFPRAGLLGSLAAIALCLIAFLQLPDIFKEPLIGLPALVVILITLIGRNRLPFGIPGALGSVAIGCVVWYLILFFEKIIAGNSPLAMSPDLQGVIWFPQEWLTVFTFSWLKAMPDTLAYIPYIIPFAIATVIGGIDCTESAASAGDEYPTGWVIGVESIATMFAAFCGGVIQTTPYIGHPAYKSMGGRALYTLMTALFVGAAGVVGYFNVLFEWIPKAAILPILIFIGIEITAQSFHATPRRHYAALALACLPALARMGYILLEQYVDHAKMIADAGIANLRVLSSGFIITSLIWASALAQIIDRRFLWAGAYFCVAAGLVLCGVMHSPLLGEKMFSPFSLFSASMAIHQETVFKLMGGYLLMAAILIGLHYAAREMGRPLVPITTDEEFEELQ